MENYSQQRIVRRLRSADHIRVAILGNGISAYIAQKLIPHSVIITKTPKPLFLGHVSIHDTIETRLMFRVLGLTNFSSVVVPFYYYDNITKEINSSIDDAARYKLISEKMGKLAENTSFSDISISNKIDLDEEFRHLVFDENDLIEALNDRCVEYVLNFTKIVEHDTHVNIQFDDDLSMNFEYVINTIPRYAFDDLIIPDKVGTLYKSEPVLFVTTLDHVLGIHDPNYVLYAYNDSTFKRIFRKNGMATIEYNLYDRSVDDIKANICDEVPGLIRSKFNVVPYGRIISQELQDSNRIKHIGRFAEWNHKITTEHVINKLTTLNL